MRQTDQLLVIKGRCALQTAEGGCTTLAGEALRRAFETCTYVFAVRQPKTT